VVHVLCNAENEEKVYPAKRVVELVEAVAVEVSAVVDVVLVLQGQPALTCQLICAGKILMLHHKSTALKAILE